MTAIALLLQEQGDKSPVGLIRPMAYVPGRWIGDHGLLSLIEPEGRERWVRLVRNFSKDLEGLRASEVLRDKALLALLSEQPSEAVSLLESALRKSPQDESLLNDLAVAYWTRAGGTGDSEDLLNALSNIEKSLQKRPELREALFNRALILQSLSLRIGAEKAWRAYPSSDGDPWKDIARQHLRSLLEPPLQEQWESQVSRLEFGAYHGNFGIVHELVAKFPQNARTFAQEVLMPRWAEEVQSDHQVEASQSLRAAREVGRELADLNGEQSVSDAVIDVGKAEKQGQLEKLAAAYLSYRMGLEYSDEFRSMDAEAALLRSEQLFKVVGSRSGFLWSRFWRLRVEYYLGQHVFAGSGFDRLLTDPALTRYPALRGRVLWARGLLESIQTHFELGLSSYRAAMACYQRLGESENLGAVEALIAEDLSLLGDEQEAWTYRLRALTILSAFPSSVRLHNLLIESGDKLLAQGNVSLAIYFAAEDMDIFSANRNPASMVDTLLLQSRINASSGNLAVAYCKLFEVRKKISAIQGEATRNRLSADAGLVEGEFEEAISLDHVINSISASILYYDDQELSVLTAYARLLRARIYLLAREDEASRRDLDAALGTIKNPGSVENLQAKLAFQKSWDNLLEEILYILIYQRGDMDAAFSLLEKRRAGKSALIDRARLESAVASDETIIVYALSRNQLVIWTVTNGSLNSIRVGINSGRLADAIAQFSTGLEKRDKVSSLLPRSCALFEILIRPVLDQISTSRRLVIVADGIISRVPFAALFNRKSRQYLIEKFSLQYALSVTEAVESERQKSRSSTSSWRLLAVGSPRVDRIAYPALVDLPMANYEARKIAELYAHGQLLTGGRATPSAFLKALARSDIVHFAGHARIHPINPELSRLFFAPQGGLGSNSVVYAGDFLRLKFHMPILFILSACDTATELGDGWGGLARALLDSGTSAVLASRWPVEDISTKDLFIDFHKQLLAGERASKALQYAQVRMLREGRAPRTWATFGLFGEIGGKTNL